VSNVPLSVSFCLEDLPGRDTAEENCDTPQGPVYFSVFLAKKLDPPPINFGQGCPGPPL